MLPGTVTSATSGALGFDTDTIVTSEVAKLFAEQGYNFAIRYLSLSAQKPGDLSISEAEAILNAGLSLSIVQHVRYPGWRPSEAIGASDGSHAVINAATLGFPIGVVIWCDLEGVAAGTSINDIQAYCTAWYDAVEQEGYVPGLYVGAQCGLTGNQLYALPFQHYWRSLSLVPAIPFRGYQIVQEPALSQTVNGIAIDHDRTIQDVRKGTVLWLSPTDKTSNNRS